MPHACAEVAAYGLHSVVQRVEGVAPDGCQPRQRPSICHLLTPPSPKGKTSKAKEVGIDFLRTSALHTSVNIQGLDIGMVFTSTRSWTGLTTPTSCTRRARVQGPLV